VQQAVPGKPKHECGQQGGTGARVEEYTSVRCEEQAAIYAE